MDLVCFSDLHIWNYQSFDKDNSRLENCLFVLDGVFKMASERDNIVLHMGDMFDRHNPPPSVLKSTLIRFQYLFDRYPKVQFYSISGNHDLQNSNQHDTSKISAQTYFTDFENFHLIDNQIVDLGNFKLMGIPYYKDKELFISQSKFDDNSNTILMIHQTPMMPNSMIPYDFDPKVLSDFKYVLCGHIHKEMEWKNGVLVNSPIQKDFGDEGDRKSIGILNTETLEYTRHYTNFPEFGKDYMKDIPEVIFKEKTHQISAAMSNKEVVTVFANEADLDLETGLMLLN